MSEDTRPPLDQPTTPSGYFEATAIVHRADVLRLLPDDHTEPDWQKAHEEAGGDGHTGEWAEEENR